MTEKEFTAVWIRKIPEEYLKTFPEAFIGTEETKILKLPKVELIMGEELFGNYDLLDTRHNSVMMVDDYYTAKYIVYANRTRPAETVIPLTMDSIAKIVRTYEKHLDEILKKIETEYNSAFPKSKNHLNIINEIFNHLNIKRI